VAVSVEMPDQLTTSESQAVVGVDLGIKALATLSTGEQFAAPKPLARQMERLQRLSRQLSRKQKGSQNRAKARMRVARLHAQIANIRNDALHKLTTMLVARFGTVVIEDLNVRGMQRNRRLARAIGDVGMGEFRRQLAYKVETAGVRVVVADRWYPSSKMCSACGFKLDILPLAVREWVCPQCGVVHERDINAAVNLEQLGRATPEGTPVERRALAAGSSAVQPASGKQELEGAHTCAH
jgi:putative transposase